MAVFGPVLTVWLPILAMIAREFPAWAMPSPDEGMNAMQWILSQAYRLLLPYNFMIENRMHINRYNLRYITPEDVFRTLLADWMIIFPIWLQSIIMFVLTLPLYLWVYNIL